MNTLRSIQIGFTAFGAVIGSFIGGFDGFIIALIILMVLDYVTGVIDAIVEHELNSKIGAIGILRKILMFVVIGVAHVIDVYVIKSPGVLRTATIFFYVSNEGISILENMALIGVPIPKKLKKMLAQLNEKESVPTITDTKELKEENNDETRN